MSQRVVEKPICSKCGAEVRVGTQYCYNCGSFVGKESESAGTAGRMGSIESENKRNSASVAEKRASDNAESILGAVNPDVESNLQPKPAPGRPQRPNRRPVRKPVEVVWDPTGEDVNTRFVVMAAVLIIFALISVLIIVYLK